MPSRRLEDLHPIVAAKVRAFLGLAEQAGIPLLVTQTYRSPEEQAALYAKGRDAEGRIVDATKVVTNAPPGTSAHEYGMAVDVVPLKPNGKPWWTAPAGIWNQLYKLAEQVGLDALGDRWGEYVSWDKGHFQEPGWKYLKSLVSTRESA